MLKFTYFKPKIPYFKICLNFKIESSYFLVNFKFLDLGHYSLDFCFPQIFCPDEKAMKFIQLERLYHEQLLTNLSAIQEQWGEYRLTWNIESSVI